MQLKTSLLMQMAIALSTACSASLTCHAGTDFSGIYVATGAGLASSAASGFDQTWCSEIAAGYDMTMLGFEVAYAKTGNFEVRSNRDSSINLELWRAQVHARIPLTEKLELQPLVGSTHWNATANLIGQEVGSETDSSFVWGARLNILLFKRITSGLNWLEYRDLAGTDIRTINILVRYRF